jgi:hypothetical protein
MFERLLVSGLSSSWDGVPVAGNCATSVPPNG